MKKIASPTIQKIKVLYSKILTMYYKQETWISNRTKKIIKYNLKLKTKNKTDKKNYKICQKK